MLAPLAAGTTETVITLSSGVVFLCFVMLALFMLSRMIPAGKRRHKPLPYETIVDPNPPEPVVGTAGVTVVVCATLAWAVSHLSVIFVWALTGWWVPRSMASASIALYFTAGVLISMVGAAMLLACRAQGRRAISWGLFLLSLAAFFGGVVSLLMTSSQQLTDMGRTVALYVAVGFAVHLAIDTAIGAAAQQVGKGRSQLGAVPDGEAAE